MPEYLVNSVLFSHSLNMDQADQNKADRYFHYCLNLSGSLADIWLDDNPGELLLSVLNVAELVLDVDKNEFNELIVDIDNALPEISTMFDIYLVDDSNRENVAHEARELLLDRSLYSIKKAEEATHYIDSITARVEKIEKESQLDHLTNIYNRKHIDSLLEAEYKEANINLWPLSLAFIDTDDFKLVNDTYGHLVGDEMLKLISSFFSKNIREADILAWYGGDEFLLMLPGSTEDIAKAMLERLLSLYESEVTLNVKEESLSPGVSIGLVTYKNNFNSLKEFMAAADEALYKAKSGGKNCLAIY